MSSNKVFENVLIKHPDRNVFDLSHEYKTTFNMGMLIPCLCEEVLPKDTWQVSSEVLIRLMPMIAPVMHRVDVTMHYFFVPNRIVWDDWEEFITGGEDGLSTKTVPKINITNTVKAYYEKGWLPDYLGIPQYDGSSVWAQDHSINLLPIYGYWEIYNEYYRDQNLVTLFDYVGAGSSTRNKVATRAWEKDYFTSALPWLQRGAEISLPLGSTAPVDFVGPYIAGTKFGIAQVGGPPMNNPTTGSNISMHASLTQRIETAASELLTVDNSDNLQVDLSGATASTVNEIRRAVRLQEWLEMMARGGSRYKEQLLHMFGADLPDYTAQRPVYLGGFKQPIVISEIPQNAETRQWNSDTIIEPAGTLKGHGISVGKGGMRFDSNEHGWLFGIMSVLPRTGYYQGIHKKWLRTDKEDYYWTQFAQLGEQAIENQEVYADYYNVYSTDDTFGYQQRYAEYKYAMDRISGEFTDTLLYWSLARTLPNWTGGLALNQTFIECSPTDTEVHRIFANTATADHKLIAQIWHNIKAIRPIPYFNIPTL